ncbi:MAG: c-type cytochrome [Phycisphaerae bacterium]|nr:c-type cytochrome [Phycisphaerae bacterium]
MQRIIGTVVVATGLAVTPLVVAAGGAGIFEPPAAVPAYPGWAAKYTSADRKAEVSGWSETGAFALEPLESIHHAVAPAGFTARFDATIPIADAGRYRFGAEIEGGSVRLNVFGNTLKDPVNVTLNPGGPSAGLSPWLDLTPGAVTVRLTFSRAASARARLAPVWEMERRAGAGFALEPIPALFAQVPVAARADADSHRLARGGRVSLGEMGCVNCHRAEGNVAAAVWTRQGPRLDDVGARLRPDWLVKWIRDPASIKPGTRMPKVLGDSPRDAADAVAIALYLVSRGGPAVSDDAATGPATLQAGKDLYESVGCVACHGYAEHGRAGSGDGTFRPRSVLPDLRAKWVPSALSDFLTDPRQIHPDGRMPSSGLNKAEADAIATYLVAATAGARDERITLPAIDEATVQAGRIAFAARGCVACHAIGAAGATATAKGGLAAKPLAQVRSGKGCMDLADRSSPRYALTAADIREIGAGLADALRSVGAPAPADETARRMAALNCNACHFDTRDAGPHAAVAGSFGTIGEVDLGDEGRMPPRLLGVGAKLNTPWLRRVLLQGGRARTYMSVRMPQFGEEAVGALAEALAKQDGVWPGSELREPRPNDEVVQNGRKLVGAEGLNCISCHAFSTRPLAGTPGPDLAQFAERIRYAWWDRYLKAPERLKPGTRMPAFYITGKGTVTSVYGGDPQKQGDALWAYFRLGKSAPAPDGLPEAGGMVLRVKDRPIVLRSFLRDAGSRAIAVGFPAGIHFAFDADAVRLVEAWKGEFLDASGSWANRGGTELSGQGTVSWRAPAGPGIVVAAIRPDPWPNQTGRSAGYRFHGYAVDRSGVPTFRYSIEQGGAAAERFGNRTPVSVEERAEPGPGGILRRTFTVTGLAAGDRAWFNTPRATAAQNGSVNAKIEGESVMSAVALDAAQPLTVVIEIKP